MMLIGCARARSSYSGCELDPLWLVNPHTVGSKFSSVFFHASKRTWRTVSMIGSCVVQDFLDPPVVGRALHRIHLRVPWSSKRSISASHGVAGLGSFGFHRCRLPDERRKLAPLLGSIPPVKPISTTSQSIGGVEFLDQRGEFQRPVIDLDAEAREVLLKMAHISSRTFTPVLVARLNSSGLPCGSTAHAVAQMISA